MITPPFVPLEYGGAAPEIVGAKAYQLSLAIRAGIAVPPGFVVPAEASRQALENAGAVLATQGSGSARLGIMSSHLEFADDLVTEARRWGDRFVVRSSTELESSGEWSGAFASYVDLAAEELPKAVLGCWSSAFSVSTLARLAAAGVDPGTFSVPVLIQSYVDAVAGGTAEIAADGQVVVYGVEGSPAPLLQGWTTGLETRAAASEGKRNWIDGDLLQLVGEGALNELTGILETSTKAFGADRCEWAMSDRVWALQVGISHPEPVTSPPRSAIGETKATGLVPIVVAAVNAPGPLGEELVLPWAISGFPSHWDVVPVDDDLDGVFTFLEESAAKLCEGVWGLPAPEAVGASKALLKRVRGTDPASALEQIDNLRPPDSLSAGLLMGRLTAIRNRLHEMGLIEHPADAWSLNLAELRKIAAGHELFKRRRVGTGKWEPVLGSVIKDLGSRITGTPASPGEGAGPLAKLGLDPEAQPPRQVLAVEQPLAKYAPYLWEAAGLVVGSGSPSAHLFESARSLGVPSVIIDLALGDGDLLVAIDGHAGTVYTYSMSER